MDLCVFVCVRAVAQKSYSWKRAHADSCSFCNLLKTKTKWDIEPNQRSFTTSKDFSFSPEKKSSSGRLARTSRSVKQAVQCCKSWRSVWFSHSSKAFSPSKPKTFPKLQRKRVRTYFMNGGESISESLPVKSMLKSAISPAQRSYSFRKSVASPNGDLHIPLSAVKESLVNRRREYETLIPRWFVFLSPSHQPLRAGSPQQRKNKTPQNNPCATPPRRDL